MQIEIVNHDFVLYTIGRTIHIGVVTKVCPSSYRIKGFMFKDRFNSDLQIYERNVRTDYSDINKIVNYEKETFKKLTLIKELL